MTVRITMSFHAAMKGCSTDKNKASKRSKYSMRIFTVALHFCPFIFNLAVRGFCHRQGLRKTGTKTLVSLLRTNLNQKWENLSLSNEDSNFGYQILRAGRSRLTICQRQFSRHSQFPIILIHFNFLSPASVCLIKIPVNDTQMTVCKQIRRFIFILFLLSFLCAPQKKRNTCVCICILIQRHPLKARYCLLNCVFRELLECVCKWNVPSP